LRSTVFKTAAFSHSAIPPGKTVSLLTPSTYGVNRFMSAKSAADMIWELTSDGIGDYVTGNRIVPNHGVFKEIQYETKIRHHQG
jgi:hypothetical protein